jgi:site-specific DNA-methyltransferase (adenine-specific)
MSKKRAIDVHFSSASNEWATPDAIFAKIDAAYGPFDLDPCCTKETAKCKTFITAEQDGLSQPWSQFRVFMNPPYGRAIGKWVQYAYEQSCNGGYVVCLIPSRTDTKWWHKYCMRAERIVFFKGRIKFVQAGKKAPAPFPSCLVIFRKSVDKRPIFDTMES